MPFAQSGAAPRKWACPNGRNYCDGGSLKIACGDSGGAMANRDDSVPWNPIVLASALLLLLNCMVLALLVFGPLREPPRETQTMLGTVPRETIIEKSEPRSTPLKRDRKTMAPGTDRSSVPPRNTSAANVLYFDI